MSSGHGSGGHGRRARRHEEEEHENHERWAVSYADMMTVLVGLFIVMFAISQVDQVKFAQLANSLSMGFGNPSPSVLPVGGGALPGVQDFTISPDLRSDLTASTELVPSVDRTGDERNRQLAAAEYARLDQVAEKVAAALAEQGLGDRVRFRMTERGLVIGMVADDVFFAADAATLTPTALRVLDTTGPVLASLPDEISVEGHANVLPSARFPTNWELSSTRATQVLRRLVDDGGLAPHRVSAIGYGDTRPLDASGTAAAFEANRRVDIVVLSTAPEAARGLLPEAAAADPSPVAVPDPHH